MLSSLALLVLCIPLKALWSEDSLDKTHSFLQEAFDGKLLAQVTAEDGQWKIRDFHWQDVISPLPETPKIYKLTIPKKEPRIFQILPNKTIKSRQPKKPKRKFLPLYGQCHKPYWAKSVINEDNFLKYREGSPELVQMLEKTADEACEISPDAPLHFGDLNAKEGHKGHKNGRNVDVLVSFDGFEEGAIGEIKGLNRGHGKTFHSGAAYNRDRTIKIIKKFLLFRDYVYKKKDEKGRMKLCEPYEEGCDTYEVRVKKILTSDPVIKDHFDELGFQSEVELKSDHANHFHVEIEVVPTDSLAPLIIQWRNIYTAPQPKREFQIEYPPRNPFKPR